MCASYCIETTYHLPVYRQRIYRAESLEAACRFAVEDEGWGDEKSDVESSGETFVMGIWAGEDGAWRGAALPVPSHFRETVERLSAHFDALVELLAEAAQPLGLSEAAFRAWLPRAQAALAKARAIVDSARDPD